MSTSTGADRRGHVRGDSIAQKRTGAGARAPSSPKRGAGGFDGVAVRGGEGRSGGPTAGFTIRPRLAVRLIAGSLILFAVLHFGPSLMSPSAQSIAAQAKHRKQAMAGSGESWILPRKWRDIQAGEGDVTLNGETLPVCKRVMLFKFGNSHGFSSEMLHYLRAGVIAQKLGYTLLGDDSGWNYGSITDYFLPRAIYCRPPVDWFSPDVATKVGTRRWQGKDRVWLSREQEVESDEWVRDEMLDPNAVEELRTRSLGHILPEGETLPPALEDSFSDFSTALREVWRPNDHLATLIRRQRMELGLGGGGLRHRKHSPTWGGRKLGSNAAAVESQSAEEEEEEEWEYSVSRRSDRGPVVGVHLAGDRPRVDLSIYGIQRQRAGNLSAVFEGVSDAVRRLTHSSMASPSYSRSRPTIFPPTATPTLVALTSNATLFSLFTSDSSAVSYNVLRTSPPPYDELKRYNDILRLELTPDLAAPKGSANKLLREWDQAVWNRDVPKPLKVLLTQYFLRDLTVLSQHADAFVVSGASPTGRLAILLSGEDGAIGPRDFHGGSFGGRVRSIDGFWVPTGKAKALYG
ncbi:hypothetical protein NBRC10512_008043 [Rhodotorula toruloides]|uniref:RHTO0S05e06810g1_1 n=2 Tax=Rhodotorula toruloides TaxID=5286 RepID=A0A061B144_RHOTO|nr:uncharacterized protein RHTO_06909 [Rhodotorula toruloides NP11]EMS23850.1 hypothetical protein RHTO_06909 [Rhodotorula toruloides NP11]KAJ8294169.1 hypothetical protein OF846_002731 [Rhodotorula toruloides]CDR40741.1 RHTO0S05e06810g1_1 [Rhodotorula toruloides]